MLDRRSGYEYEDLLACGRGEMFGPGNAQLPLPPMLMFDRITEITENGGEFGKGLIRAELDVKPDLWFFGCHFKNDPVMPGCLGLDAMWQMVGFYLGWSRRRGARPGAGAGRIEVLRPGAAERPQGCVQHRHETRDAFKAGAWRCRRLAFHGWRDYLSRQGPEGRAVQAGHRAGLSSAITQSTYLHGQTETAGRGDHEAGCHHGDGYCLVHRK